MGYIASVERFLGRIAVLRK